MLLYTLSFHDGTSLYVPTRLAARAALRDASKDAGYGIRIAFVVMAKSCVVFNCELLVDIKVWNGEDGNVLTLREATCLTASAQLGDGKLVDPEEHVAMCVAAVQVGEPSVVSGSNSVHS